MTIAFTCPSCEHRLKVKDELAGRKVKCPSCGGGVLVPDGEEEEEAAAPTRPKRQARETDADEDRPRKKRRKKKSNKGLIIGLAIGGAALVAVAILVIVLNLPKSQPNKEPDKGPVAQQPVQNPVQPPQPHPEQRVAGIANRGADTEVRNDMRQIGIFYTQYLITNPKGPRNVKAFADEIRRDARHIAEALDKQIYVLLPGVRRGANMIVAYDVPGNSAGQHIVLMGDGSVQDMPRTDLEQYLKQQVKQ